MIYDAAFHYRLRALLMIALFLITAALVGCAKHGPMTNDEIVKQTMLCNAHGLEAQVVEANWDGEITEIQCVPK